MHKPRLAYLVNRYPAISHTFIRREVRAMEAQGAEVRRYSLRPVSEDLVDEADREEQAQTRVVLGVGMLGLVMATLRTAAAAPGRFFRTLALAWQLGQGSYRPMHVHLAYLAEACVLLRWLNEEGVDHLHAHFGSNPAAVAMLTRSLGGPPYSFMVHGPDDFDRAAVMGFDLKIGRAAFVTAITHYCRSQLYRWCDPQDWPKIHIVRCGIDQAYLDHEPPPVGIEPQLVSIGRLTAAKGQLLLVEAARRLKEEGLDFRIVLVGGGGMRPRIEQMIRLHGVEEHLLLTGWASGEQVRRHLLASRALCLPSFAEGLPVVAMEALALGRPVIATHIAGLPELVTPGETGWLAPAGAVEPLVDAMREALTAPVAELERMRREGRRRVLAQHDVRKNAQVLMGLVHASVAGECGPASSAASGSGRADRAGEAAALAPTEP